MLFFFDVLVGADSIIANCFSNNIPEMVELTEPLNSSFVLKDPSDPRHTYFIGLRHRFGRFLFAASSSLRDQGEENTIDAVNVLVCCFTCTSF